MSRTVVAIFSSYDAAENAAREVKSNGLKTDDISIVSKDTNGQNMQQSDQNTYEGKRINDNVSDGTLTGGVMGGLAGLLLGMGTMVIPGLGVIAAAGPVAGLLSGALTGGIVGGLVDLGIPEEAGHRYASDVEKGKIFWSMRTDEDNINNITRILENSGAQSVEVH